ncbi:MAG: alpha/beta fold hydrolase [Phycisphaerales bacterium]
MTARIGVLPNTSLMSTDHRHHLDDASLPDIITGTTRDRVTGMDIRIDRMGEGTTLVVLNGLLGLNAHWFPTIAPLADRVESLCIQPPILEMRGKGATVQGVSSLVVSCLESLLDGPAVIMGNSLGGHIALRIAHARPDLVRALVLIGSSGLLERGFEKGVRHTPTPDWIYTKVRELFYSEKSILPGMVEMVHEELSRRPAARAFVKLGRSAKVDHLGSILPEIGVPTQLIWGRQDIVTPPSVAEQFARDLPDARLAWLDDCGHAPHIEYPDAVRAVLTGFLDELEQRQSQHSVA